MASDRFTEIADKLRAHDCAQRNRISELEKVILKNRELLKELSAFFLDDGSTKVHELIEKQIQICKDAINNR